MYYNFDFLKKEDKYKDFTYACIEAESTKKWIKMILEKEGL